MTAPKAKSAAQAEADAEVAAAPSDDAERDETPTRLQHRDAGTVVTVPAYQAAGLKFAGFDPA